MIDRLRPAGGGAPLPTVLDVFGSLPQFHLIDPLGESKGAHTLVTILLSSVGLRLTNINALPSPLRQSCRRYVSFELRKGTCLDPLARLVKTSPRQLRLLLMACVSLRHCALDAAPLWSRG
jgi:hypothetical protein